MGESIRESFVSYVVVYGRFDSISGFEVSHDFCLFLISRYSIGILYGIFGIYRYLVDIDSSGDRVSGISLVGEDGRSSGYGYGIFWEWIESFFCIEERESFLYGSEIGYSDTISTILRDILERDECYGSEYYEDGYYYYEFYEGESVDLFY